MFKILDSGDIVISQNTIPSFNDLLKFMKIKSETFASKVLYKMYLDLYKNSVDLKYLYSKYYSIEYSSFEKYLLFKYGINPVNLETKTEHLLIIKPTAQLFEPIYEDNYLLLVLKAIEENYEN